MTKEMREIYEEEAKARPDLFYQIYERGSPEGKAVIPFWAVYLLKLKQMWLESVFAELAQADVLVLDAGCGPGYVSAKYSRAKCPVYGADISFNYLRIARQKCNSPHFVQCDLSGLPFKDESFDIVICSEVLEHLPDLQASLSEIKRVSKRLFISTVPLLPKFADELRVRIQRDKIISPGKGHLRNFQAAEYLGMILGLGFKIRSARVMGFLWWIFAWPVFNRRIKWVHIAKIDTFFSNLKLFSPLGLDLGVVAEKRGEL